MCFVGEEWPRMATIWKIRLMGVTGFADSLTEVEHSLGIEAVTVEL
jgi:hypothetical protein